MMQGSPLVPPKYRRAVYAGGGRGEGGGEGALPPVSAAAAAQLQVGSGGEQRRGERGEEGKSHLSALNHRPVSPPPPRPLRRTVISLCRHITALDHRPVFPQERAYAESWWLQETASRAAAEAGGGGSGEAPAGGGAAAAGGYQEGGEAAPLASPRAWGHSSLADVFSDDERREDMYSAAAPVAPTCANGVHPGPISSIGHAASSAPSSCPIDIDSAHPAATAAAAAAAASLPWIGSSGVLHPVLSYLEPRHLVTAALACR